MSDPMKPSPSLLAKIGSIAQHVDEGTGPGGHAFDIAACHALLKDPEVSAWLDEMDRLSLLPKKR